MKKKTNITVYIESFAEKYKKILLILLAVVLIGMPYVVSDQYVTTIAIKIGVYAIMALGLNILTGYTGLVSLGHAGFVAIGAYTSAVLAVACNVNFFIALIAGIITAGIAGVLLGLPTLRLSGTYLSIVTLGFGEIVKTIAMNWKSVTNGTLGIKNIPAPEFFGIKLTVANYGLYFLMLAVLVIVTLFCIVVVKSKTGRALMAIKTDEMAATMMGINVTFYKVLAFVISGCICACAGSIYAVTITYIDHNTFTFDVSTLILSIVILGGMGTTRGMFIGAALLIIFPEISRSLMDYRFVVYGLILVIMMRFRPQGLLGWKSQLPYKLSKNNKAKLAEIEKVSATADSV